MKTTTERTFEAAQQMYQNDTGVRTTTPRSCIKSGSSPDPFILTDTANLDRLEALRIYKTTKTCTPKYLVLQCSCGRHIVPSTCMSLNCPGCKKYVSKRRSASIFRRLMAEPNRPENKYKRYNRKNVLYTICTVPVMERYKYINPAEWQKVRRKLWKVLKERFGALYGVEATHPVGDKDPGFFHPHLNFLWIQKPGLRGFLDVNELREAWAKILSVDVADVYHQYNSNVRKIKHWCNYVSRTFPGTHGWTGPVRWYGKYPIINNKVTVTCGQCSSGFVAIGWIDKDTVDNYYKHGFMIGVDPPWKRDSQIVPFRKFSPNNAMS